MTRIYPAALVIGLLLLGVTGELLRRRQLREKYAALWLVVGLGSLVLAVFPGLLTAVSRPLGFAVPANLLFLLAVAVLTAICMHLSLETGRLESETQRLAEEVALLRLDLSRLRDRDPQQSAQPGQDRVIDLRDGVRSQDLASPTRDS